MKTLLISDLHLSPERPTLTAAFIRFLKDRASQCESLYILGDLFEAWVGDDDPASLSQAIIAELKAAGLKTELAKEKLPDQFIIIGRK